MGAVLSRIPAAGCSKAIFLLILVVCWESQMERRFVLVIALLFGNYGEADGVLGAMCQLSWQCYSNNEFCYENQCRTSLCTSQANCRPGETCQYGYVDGNGKFACFPTPTPTPTPQPIDSCPGGGSVVYAGNGQVQACSASTPCPGGNICNPKLSVCCSKLRTCKSPRQPEFDKLTNQPKTCMQGNNVVSSCGNNSKCEQESGFCCMLPRLGQVCDTTDGCSTENSKCVCVGLSCKCLCLTELGYGDDATATTCVRTRRALQEKCNVDAECGAAFAQCSSAGCRCRPGFQRDSTGGCRPLEYRCANKSQPRLDSSGKPAICEKRPNPAKFGNDISFDSNRKCKNVEDDFIDDCPLNYYCVPFFDVPDRPNRYQGFCCPTPRLPPPQCPVGIAHSTSAAPNYGCTSCPLDHFCHLDLMVSNLEICCPKACSSPDDVYIDGQCYPVARYGEICKSSGQCLGRTERAAPLSDLGLTQPMMCKSGKCACEKGFIEANGRCLRVMCTVGTQGDPTVDANGLINLCSSTVTNTKKCAQEEICDPTFGVCCPRQNRCPSGFMETGATCASSYCSVVTDSCYRLPASSLQICCRPTK